MTVLERLKDKTPIFYNNTKELLWNNMGCVSSFSYVSICIDHSHRLNVPRN